MFSSSPLGDTIAAIATAIVPEQGSIGVVRVSGSLAVPIARQLFRAPGQQIWSSHRLLYGYLRNPQTRQTVDEALLLIMLAPRSYTREDVVEFHCHGGIIPIQQVLQLCLEAGARLAQPGEFTLRAFLNGRLDLTQAESIAQIVGANSPQASQIALAGLRGKLAQPLRQIRASCIDILAEVEARLDFEDDLPPLDEEHIHDRLNTVVETVQSLLATAPQGELLRTGLKVAIVGRPNVGKSSLLNAWSKSDRAIVTPLPGTTRDVVESHLVVQGIPILVLDTAGIRETEDTVEKIGVERSHQAAAAADLVLFTLDAEAGWTGADEAIYNKVKERPLILVINKIDLSEADPTAYPAHFLQVVKTAAAKNQGIEDLEQAILKAVQAEQISAANLDFAINQRQAATLQRALNSLEQVKETIRNELPLDFWTIDLRNAIQALGEITGEDVTESVLEKIFSQFCIGK